METIIIKLGGALLTDKSKPFSLRFSIVKRVANEIAKAYKECNSRIVVIHGGGSYGHYVVDEHGSIDNRDAISQTVWFMRELNMVITDAIVSFGVPAIPFDTHAMATMKNGVLEIKCTPIVNALGLGLVPILYGDIVLSEDSVSIVSGDELAWYLGKELAPSRILFATTVDGVYDRDPSDPRARLLGVVRLSDIENLSFSYSRGLDVTGGMRLKLALGLRYSTKGIKEVLIFSGLKEGQIYRAICGLQVDGSKVLMY